MPYLSGTFYLLGLLCFEQGRLFYGIIRFFTAKKNSKIFLICVPKVECIFISNTDYRNL